MKLFVLSAKVRLCGMTNTSSSALGVSRNWTPAATDPAGFREGDFMVATEKMLSLQYHLQSRAPLLGSAQKITLSLFNKDKVGPPQHLGTSSF